MTTEIKTKTKTKRTAKAKVTPAISLEDLAAEWINVNKEANALRAKADKIRKELFNQMEEAGVDNLEGLVYIAANETLVVVDPVKFSKMVSPENFWQAISVSKGKAELYLPSAAVDKCCVTVAGDRNVHKAK